jgi:hypothetical protein
LNVNFVSDDIPRLCVREPSAVSPDEKKPGEPGF